MQDISHEEKTHCLLSLLKSLMPNVVDGQTLA